MTRTVSTVAVAALLGVVVALLSGVAGVGRAEAAPQRRHAAYALVIGSTRGGPGQEDLEFARDDAQRVRDVLVEIGGYAPEAVALVVDPSPATLLDALDGARAALAEHARRGEPALFLFYYSGHARATALDMGDDELPLTTLRARLEALPSTVTLAVLDACQTGAISGVKGAEPVADFSYNSVDMLQTAGIAVLASSSGSELSQESPTLGASIFTHHLVTGLRGAADGDADGRVTLSEAYRYAYDRTLVSSAATAVGKQHVILETALKGRGDMVLTWPADASSGLSLPSDLAAEILIHTAPHRVVVAEVAKSSGGAVRLAFPPGAYVAWVRRDEETLRCDLDLAADETAVLEPAACVAAEMPVVAPKGPPEPWRERWSLEIGAGLQWTTFDRYIGRAEDFGFSRGTLFPDEVDLSVSVTAGYAFSPYLSVHLGWTMLDEIRFGRTMYGLGGDARQQDFSLEAHAIGAAVRGSLPLPLDRDVFKLYAQLGVGFTFAFTKLEDELPASPEVDEETFWGWHLDFIAGAQVMPWDHFGFFVQGGYILAPTVENLVGDSHNDGGPLVQIGIRGAL